MYRGHGVLMVTARPWAGRLCSLIDRDNCLPFPVLHSSCTESTYWHLLEEQNDAHRLASVIKANGAPLRSVKSRPLCHSGSLQHPLHGMVDPDRLHIPSKRLRVQLPFLTLGNASKQGVHRRTSHEVCSLSLFLCSFP